MDNGKPAPALGIFLLFFLLTPISPTCRKFTADECKAAHLVPGHNVVGLGFDITTMESTQGMVLDMNLSKDTDGTCTLCKNTLLEGNPLQILPLAVTEWNVTDECKQEEYESWPLSFTSLAMKIASTVYGVWDKDINLLPLYPYKAVNATIVVGSQSKIMTFSQYRSAQDKHLFFLHKIICKKYRVRIRENPPISEEFKESVKRLPEHYDNTSKKEYLDLIRTYGTNYLLEADLGGIMRSVTALRYCEMLLTGFTTDEINHCVTDVFRSAIGFGTSKNDICKRFDSLTVSNYGFKSCTHITQGGNQRIKLCDRQPKGGNYKMWLAELPVFPELITYSMEPIHLLVDKQDTRREALKLALTDYIKLRSVVLRCTNTCPTKHSPTAFQDCACKCSSHGLTNDDCCAKQLGISTLTVWVDRAHDLQGDWFSEADAAVEVEFFGITMRTDYVWNNNNPVFNRQFDFGIVQLVRDANSIQVRVKEWNPLSEFFTDRFTVDIGAGPVQSKFYSLKHGDLRLRYQVVCGPYLTGHNCREYKPQEATYSNNFGLNFLYD